MDPEDLYFDYEIKNLTNNSQETVNEMERFTEFLTKYISNTKEFLS